MDRCLPFFPFLLAELAKTKIERIFRGHVVKKQKVISN